MNRDLKQVVKNVGAWVARRKLRWQIPIIMTTSIGISALLLALYEMVTLGRISATLIDAVKICYLMFLAMSFGVGMALDSADEWTP